MRNACVIGYPAMHSLSPKLHGYWLKQYHITGNYSAVDVIPEQLPAFVERLRDGEFVGCNVTLPHKENIIALLDAIDETAHSIGAVNTVVNNNGTLKGMNTDAFGFIENIRANAELQRKEKAVVLGAGGAARAVVRALADDGFAQIMVLNRTVEKARQLARHFGGAVVAGDWDAREAMLQNADLLVNTTSLGLAGKPALSLSLAQLPKSAVVNDIVYTPLMTPLLLQAKAQGYRIVDGLGMLMYQAVPAFEAWYGVRPEVTAALRARLL